MVKVILIILAFLGYGAVINYYEHSNANAYAVGTKGSDFCKELLGSKRAARRNDIKFKKWLKDWRGTSGICYVRIGGIWENPISKQHPKYPYRIHGDNVGHSYKHHGSLGYTRVYLNLQAPVSREFAENAEVGDVVKFKVKIIEIADGGYITAKSHLIN